MYIDNHAMLNSVQQDNSTYVFVPQMSAGTFLMPTPTRTRNNLLNDTRTRRPILFVHLWVPAIFNVIPTPTRTRSTVEFVHPCVPAGTPRIPAIIICYFLIYQTFNIPFNMFVKICILYDLYYDKLYVRLSTFNP